VAGREWWYEEATLTTPEPAEPHGTQEMRRTQAFRRVINGLAILLPPWPRAALKRQENPQSLGREG